MLNDQSSAPSATLVDLSVTVAVSTLGTRLSQLVLPPPCPGIDYLILAQGAEGLPCPAVFSERDDVTFRALQSLGLSKSRNAALDHATGALLVFADDDMVLLSEGILALARMFTEDQSLDFAAGWRSDRLPRAGRRGRPHRLHHFNSGRICAPELMVRCSSVKSAGLRFDSEFGLGARYGLGEEFIFVTDALKAGLHGRSLPMALGVHPEDSTGDDWTTPNLMRARIAMLGRAFGPWAAPVRLLYALRYRRRVGGLGNLWRFSRGVWK